MRILATSSVALIHFHYVTWHHPPGSPSSAAPINLHDLAWHHLVLTCYWHHCPPKRLNKSFYEAFSCAAANFSGVICTDKIHRQVHYSIYTQNPFCERRHGGYVREVGKLQ